MVISLWLFILTCLRLPIVSVAFSHVKEMNFKFWFDPGDEECYHETLEKGTRLYFIYEVLNNDRDGHGVIVSFRNAHNGNIVAVSKPGHRGNVHYEANETALIDICIHHEARETYVKYLSVFFHIYETDKILTQLKEMEHFQNSSMEVANAIGSITNHLMLTREYQIEVEMLNQKDDYFIEKNLYYVNRSALVHILIMFICFLFQTYFIKRLFQTSRK